MSWPSPAMGGEAYLEASKSIPATESAIGLRPRMALSSAQLLPEWITSTPPCNTFAANGDYPLN